MNIQIFGTKKCNETKKAERFFKELPGQLFVLSTNEELRHQHIATLDQQIANIYMLEYGDDKRTRILEGNYFEV